MHPKLTPRQLLTVLEPGNTYVLLDPQRPQKVIAQASRVAAAYFLTGPLFSDYVGVELGPPLDAGRRAGEAEAATVALLNKFLRDHQVPAEAQVHTCTDLAAALETLTALFTHYATLAR